MKLDSSTLFVNTGRKPLPAMQKRKKNNKNTIALAVCVAIIAVLCVFVGLIVRVWFNYNEEVKPKEPAPVVETVKKAEPKTEPKKAAPKKTEKKTEKKIQTYTSMGTVSDISKAADKAFESVEGTYAYGVVTLNDDYTYINNTDKIHNSAALAAFLTEYASDAIYLGKFDYSTDVMGHAGRDLMTNAFSHGSVEAANLLIEHFGVDRLNAYFEAEGYTNTRFGGTIGSGNECYTTVEDLIKLMKKLYNNTTFFPYSDMYNKMRVNTVDDKIAGNLPAGTGVVNISFQNAGETFDAAIVYTSSGNYMLVTMVSDTEDKIADANNAIASAANEIYNIVTGAE